jgi:NADPH-dependent F420 reductase
MRIAVIGTGHVGAALGQRWAQGGHEVIFGTRDAGSAKVQALLRSAGPTARAASAAEAMAAAEVILLATPWGATRETLASAGDLTGKIVVDATNPLGPDGGLAVGQTTSAGELVASWAPSARVVKAFNSTGAGNMTNSNYGGTRLTMFICGDDPGAKRVVACLAEALGFEAVDAGPLAVARYLEPLAGLWVTLAYRVGLGTDIAFALLRR